jgi:hypothetical protein
MDVYSTERKQGAKSVGSAALREVRERFAEEDDVVGTALARGGYPTSMWNQLRVLCWRAVLQFTRSPADVLRRIASNMLIGTLIGVVFKNTVGRDGAMIPLFVSELPWAYTLVCTDCWRAALTQPSDVCVVSCSNTSGSS